MRHQRISVLLVWLFLSGICNLGYSQSNGLNQNFDGFSATIPICTTVPSTNDTFWCNRNLADTIATNEWRFDNPGNRILNFPISGQFAILDAAHYSADSMPEHISLESVYFDVSGTNNVLLSFDHFFNGAPGDTGFVEVRSDIDSAWVTIDTFANPTLNGAHQQYDVSSVLAGFTAAKLRFRWKGDTISQYWALDNVRVQSPLDHDAGIAALNNPSIPFQAGFHNVAVSLTNFGLDPLNNVNIEWTIAGVSGGQPILWTDTTGNGLAPLGTEVNIPLTSVFFLPDIPVEIKVWTAYPNGVTDQDPTNDTLCVTVYPALCGTYYIGGTNPDFVNFTAAAEALNRGGVNCPVTFLVADSIYNEQIILFEIPGVNAQDTVLFQSISGDSIHSGLDYTLSNPTSDYTVLLLGTDYVTFRGLSIRRGSGNSNALRNWYDADHNRFENNWISRFNLRRGRDITVMNNRIDGGIASDEMTNFSVVDNFIGIEMFLNSKSKSVLIQGNSGNARWWMQYDNHDVDIIGNTVGGHGNHWVLNLGSGSPYSSRINISDNSFSGVFGINAFRVDSVNFQHNTVRTTHDGIRVHIADSVLIKENSFSGRNGVRAETGIYLQSGSRIHVDSDTISFVERGILHSGSVDPIIEGNFLNDVRGNAIELSGASGSQVLQNRIQNVDQGAGIRLNNSNALIANNFIHAGGQGRTVGISTGGNAANSTIAFNSINITGIGGIAGRAFEFTGGSNLTIKNNSFANNGDGYAAYATDTIPIDVELDYNNYFSQNGPLGRYLDSNYTSLVDWQQATGKDSASFQVNPFYNDSIDLKINHIVLNAAADPIPGIIMDIDGVVRGANPDIGAQEFVLCDPDVGINKIIGLPAPITTGSHPVYVELQNHGTQSVSNIDIFLEVNGSITIQALFTGQLPAGADTTLFIDMLQVAPNGNYDLRAWTELQSPMIDCQTANDTAIQFNLSAPLCGTYTIGSPPSDFLNFTEAVSQLNSVGIGCSVVFQVKDTIYDEQVRILEVEGTSDTSTITFESVSGDSSLAGIHYTQLNSTNDYGVNLYGTDHITFKNLSLLRSNGSSSVVFENGVNDIHFENNWIYNILSPVSSIDSAIYFMSNEIDSSIILNACQGVELVDNHVAWYIELEEINKSALIAQNRIDKRIKLGVNNEEIAIRQNTISNSSNNWAIQLGYSGNPIVKNKRIRVLENQIPNTEWGIFIGFSDSVTVSRNKINATTEGISVVNSDSISIAENMISGTTNRLLTGIRLVSGFNIVIEADTITYAETGILHAGGFNTLIQRNILNDIHGNGIDLTGGGPSRIVENHILNHDHGVGISVNNGLSVIANNFVHGGGNGYKVGIELGEFSFGDTIAFNSVNITGNSQGSSRSLLIKGGLANHIQNNSFANNGDGYAIWSDTLIDSTVFLNTNNYFSQSGPLSRLGVVDHQTLADWQTASGKDSNSTEVDPHHTAPTDPEINHAILNDAAQPVTGILTDILGVLRNSNTPDIGAQEFAPCPQDAGVNQFVGLQNPISAGTMPVQVEIRNHGTIPLGGIIVFWEVNQVIQNPILFPGPLLPGQDTVVTLSNSFNFQADVDYSLRAWTEFQPPAQDCNRTNDTLSIGGLSTPLCGNYNIGGINADFLNFTEAVSRLNSVGVSCAVTFWVNDSIYDEQVRILPVTGASTTSDITFTSVNGDRNVSGLHYTDANPTLDHTVSLYGAEHIRFEDLSILRSNGTDAIRIEDNARDILLRNNVISRGYVLNSSEITIQGDSIATHLGLESSDDLEILDNWIGRDLFPFVACQRVRVNGNTMVNGYIRMKRNNHDIEITENTINSNSAGNNFKISVGYYGQLQPFGNSRVLIENNRITAVTHGIEVMGSDSVSIKGNILQVRGEGIRVDLSDSVYVGRNHISGVGGRMSSGIRMWRNPNTRIHIEADTIINANIGIFDEEANSPLIRGNVVEDIRDKGVHLRGGNAPILVNNQFRDVQQGYGIWVNVPNALVANNFVEVRGIGGATGIGISANANNSQVIFNSFNVTATSGVFGRAMALFGGNNHAIYNNSFANTGNGYAVVIPNPISPTVNIDFNNYYSADAVTNLNGYFGSYNGTVYSDLSSWQNAIARDGNSRSVEPLYHSPTDLHTFQRAFNGAGLPIGNILEDIDYEIRNGTAPDIGADEFNYDLGITQLLNPTQNCNQGPNEPVTVNVNQFGDIPFIDQALSYQVNGGQIYTDTINGQNFFSFFYTFDTTQDLSNQGHYEFKSWLVGVNDDNINNDTLIAIRSSQNPPVVNNMTLPQSSCPGATVSFQASASIALPDSIDRYEWDFGDGQTAVGQMVNHTYTTGDTFVVTLYVYSNQGCFTDLSDTLIIYPAPQINLGSDTTICDGNPLTLDAGPGFASYFWSDSTNAQMTTIADSGTYHVTVTDANNCFGSDSITINLNQSSGVSMTSLNLRYCISEPMDFLLGTPSGGVYSGPGIIDPNLGTFHPDSAGLGIHHITYTVTDSNGCVGFDTDSTFVDNSILLWFRDYDQDNFGDPNNFLIGCIQPVGYINVAGDCNDSSAVVNPAMAEICGDGLDNDCDPNTPDSLLVTGTVTDASCPSCGDGTIDITVAGGTPPYSYTWQPGGTTAEDLSGVPAGTYTVEVRDTFGGCIRIDTFVVNAQTGYSIPAVQIPCGTDSFSVCINANQTVQNGIVGMDFCMEYDTTLMRPTGTLEPGIVVTSSVSNPVTDINYVMNYQFDPGKIWTTLYYTQLTSTGPFFTGPGAVACVDFVLEPGAMIGDSAHLQMCELVESYLTGDTTRAADPGIVSVVGDSTFNGKLVFWNDSSGVRPLSYDTTNPGDYLVTEIYGADTSCGNLAPIASVPDTMGHFEHQVSQGASIIILRDVPGDSTVNPACISVMDYINGMDSYLAGLITTGFPTFVPNPYQMIAADVNMSGSILANDIALINARTISNVCEFPQAWNYGLDSLGNMVPNANYQPSLDWLFVDSTLAATSPDFVIDGLYPFANNSDSDQGYWRHNIPYTPLCTVVDTGGTPGCFSGPPKAFYSILLGDLDGNWQPGPTPVQVRIGSQDKITFDLINAQPTGNGFFRIPVYYNSIEEIHAIDLMVDYDEVQLGINTAGAENAAPTDLEIRWNDFMGEQLNLTSYTMTGMDTTAPVLYLEVSAGLTGPTLQDLGFIKGYLNGERVNVEILYNVVTGGMPSDQALTGWLNNIYPNPANETAQFEYKVDLEWKNEPVSIVAFDQYGREMVKFDELAEEGTLTMDVQNWSSGGYIVVLFRGEEIIDRKKFFVAH